MASCNIVFLSILAAVASNQMDWSFPPGFQFGTSTASYQVEGGWNASDKGESIWDRYAHTPGNIVDNSTGDVACDSYHQWRRDIEVACEMGLQFYRFSISWTRLLPNGFANHVSEDGKKYYSKLIDGLLKKGIQPLVTLYHWDLPQVLQDLGGWTNPLIADWFADYARVVFSLYADRVKIWITMNEPIVACDVAYSGILAPGVNESYVAPYLCNKNLLIAHAKAWRIYDKEFKPKYNGKVSISNHIIWFQSKHKGDDLGELAMQFTAGRYSHPIFSKNGGWPPSSERIMAKNSVKLGFPRTRLPPFSNREKNLVRGTYDFIGLNYYTSKLVRPPRTGEMVPFTFLEGIPELNAILESFPNDSPGYRKDITVHPEGLREVLAWLKRNYGDLEVLITENGYATRDRVLEDPQRISFIKRHLEQILLSIKKDGVNVTGYTYWSLMDNFEWTEGYTAKFGLYDVDFSDPRRRRTPKASSLYYSKVISSQSLDVHN